METATLNADEHCTGDMSAEQFPCEDSSYLRGVFGEPKLPPRIGDEYQAEIPALITGDQYVPSDFGLELSLPITWITNIKKVSEDSEDEKQKFANHSTDVIYKSEPLISESVVVEIDPHQRSSYFLVPGVCRSSWDDTEEASFVLGLYIFKKKFDQLKRFIGSKKMEEILLFYYGKFYRSTEYSRWTTCRKENIRRKRKCVCGEQIFSGLRQQELLSRLLPKVSKECKEVLTEVSRSFAEGDLSLIDYVFSLKNIIGLRNFIEAVGIGKGKQDLTGDDIHPEIPVGKACSSLTPAQIVNFLRGNFRLSKARSNDLFWEAVWPRLLARGWHSEQPKNHSLVFLIPGIRNFSRELRKGSHYYDSVTDVLSKVGFEPELLELNTEKDEGQKSEQSEWFEETTKKENLPEKRHCYLQPRTACCDMDVMKFTIVDTSLAVGKYFKVTELRTLPMDRLKIEILSEDSYHCTSELLNNEPDCAHNMIVDQEEKYSTINLKILSDSGKMLDSSSSDRLIKISGPEQNKSYDDDKQTTKAVRGHLNKKLKRNEPDSLASVPKRQRTMAACNNEEISSRRHTHQSVPRHTPGPNEKEGPCHERSLFTGSPKGSSSQSTGEAQTRILLDLNLPQQPVEFENGTYMIDSTHMQSKELHDDFGAPKASADNIGPDHPVNINTRRQSTRNRPPTARALEALANGYLTASSRRKKDSDVHETARSRPRRRVEAAAAATRLTTNDNTVADENGNGNFSTS